MKKQMTAVFDFDGVIAEYDGFKGNDIFGKVIIETKQTISALKKMGWKVIIFTTRAATPKLKKYLDDNEIGYDEINKNSDNPTGASDKPIADIYIDDRAVNYHGQNKKELLQNIKDILSKNKYQYNKG